MPIREKRENYAPPRKFCSLMVSIFCEHLKFFPSGVYTPLTFQLYRFGLGVTQDFLPGEDLDWGGAAQGVAMEHTRNSV